MCGAVCFLVFFGGKVVFLALYLLDLWGEILTCTGIYPHISHHIFDSCEKIYYHYGKNSVKQVCTPHISFVLSLFVLFFGFSLAFFDCLPHLFVSPCFLYHVCRPFSFVSVCYFIYFIYFVIDLFTFVC